MSGLSVKIDDARESITPLESASQEARHGKGSQWDGSLRNHEDNDLENKIDQRMTKFKESFDESRVGLSESVTNLMKKVQLALDDWEEDEEQQVETIKQLMTTVAQLSEFTQTLSTETKV